MKPRAFYLHVLVAGAVVLGGCSTGGSQGARSRSRSPARVATSTTSSTASTAITSTSTSTWMLAAARTPPALRRSNGALPAAEGFTAAPEWLRLQVETRGTRMAPGGTLRGVLSATNESDAIWDLTHPGSAPVHYGLFLDGERVSVGYGEAAALYPDRIQPHETRLWEFSTQATDNRGAPLRAGVYDFYVAVSTLWGQWCATRVAITVA